MKYQEKNSLDKYRDLTPAQRKLVLKVLNEAALKFKRKYATREGALDYEMRDAWQAMYAAHELLTAYGYLTLKRRGKTPPKRRRRWPHIKKPTGSRQGSASEKTNGVKPESAA